MEISKISSYTDFLSHIEYPAVIFCEDGEILSINNVAVKIIGNQITSISMEPDKFMSSDEFWPTLESRKSIIWHRLLLTVDKKDKYVVSGFVNQFEYNNKKAYIVLFELRSDVSIGSVSLERMINHIGVVALYLYRPDGSWRTRYVSKNITEYGYTEGGFYKGDIRLNDLLVKSDYDILVGHLYKAKDTGSEDFEMQARLVAANNSISPMTLKCHMVRTSQGEVDGVEFLFIRNRQPSADEEQHSYIMSVMNKIKSFVVVLQIENGKAHYKYITPNAKTMGINVEALRAGNKLIEDYIHPQDRNRVLMSTRSAIRSGKSDFEEEYRIVDDSGKIRWVKAQSSIAQVVDASYTVEFMVTDITDQKNLEHSVVEARRKYEDKISYIMNNNVEQDDEKAEYVDYDKWATLVKGFAEMCQLYSALITPDGKQLVEPSGPPQHIGAFYDLFEKPQYKDIFVKLNEVILQNNVPIVMEMDDGISESRISGAPVVIGGKHIATWILCAYDKEDEKRLRSIYKTQWKMCTFLSEYSYNSKILAKEASRSKSVEMLLEEKIRRQKILTDALNAMDDDSNSGITAIMKQTGEYLGIDVMAVYSKKEGRHYECSYIWSAGQSMSAEEYIVEWQIGNTRIPYEYVKDVEYILVDDRHPNKAFQQIVDDSPVQSFFASPIKVNDLISGYVVMASTVNNKVWSEDDLEFSIDIRNVLQGSLARLEGDGNIRTINKLLIDTYNYVKVGIFIRDAETGEVLFSNQPLNTMLGYDFTGKDSKTLIRDLNDRFRGIGVVQNPFLPERKEVTWRSYIRQFDKIMDLSEVSMKWLDGRNASLVILRDVQE